jgi:hypothetical protein
LVSQNNEKKQNKFENYFFSATKKTSKMCKQTYQHNKQTNNKQSMYIKKYITNSKYKHTKFKKNNKELRNKIMKQKALICKMTS